MKYQRGEVDGIFLLFTTALVILLILAAAMIVFPIYGVWQQRLSGEAALAKAEQTRQISISQAKAEEQAASHRAKAIEIMGEAAKKYPEYRQQEFIGAFAEAMHNGRINQIIYVPTEAGIPLLEAGHRK